MEIKILGGGCAKCKRLEKLARKVVEELGVEATFAKVKDLDAIMAYDVMSTPALVIDEQVKSSGRGDRSKNGKRDRVRRTPSISFPDAAYIYSSDIS